MMRGCLFGCPTYHHDLIVSTQIEAKRLAAQGEPEGTLVISRVQSGGYGRKGDAWDSAAGGLWFSVILRPKFSTDAAEKLSLAIGGALAEIFKKHLPQAAFEVKAPNDVLAVTPEGKRKVCGLILEGGVSGDHYDSLILGVGINVNNVLAPALGSIATTLEQLSGRPVPRMPILKSVLQNLEKIYLEFSR